MDISMRELAGDIMKDMKMRYFEAGNIVDLDKETACWLYAVSGECRIYSMAGYVQDGKHCREILYKECH